MEHLETHYGTVSTKQLSDNELQMRKTWNLPSTIESLWKQLDDGKSFASGSKVPIDDARVVLYAKELLPRLVGMLFGPRMRTNISA